MKRWLWRGGAVVWGLLVFVAVVYLMFPSRQVADRVSHMVRVGTNGQYQVSMATASPWWFGLSADNVVVSASANPRVPDALPEPFFAANNLSVRLAPWSVVRDQHKAFFELALGEGTLSGFVRTGGAADLSPRAVNAVGDQVPLGELLALAGVGGEAFDMTTTGGVDLDADLRMGRGLSKAEGDVSIEGTDIMLDTLTAASMGWVDEPLDALVEELDIRAQITEGEGEITRAVVHSSLIDIDIEGTFQLADSIGRTRVDLEVLVELKDWEDTPLASFRSVADSFMRTAKWADDRYHYEVSTTLSRLTLAAFRPARERSSSRSAPARTPTTRPTVTRPTPTVRPPVDRAARPTTNATRAGGEIEEEEILDDEEDFEDEEGFDEEGFDEEDEDYGDEEEIPEDELGDDF